MIRLSIIVPIYNAENTLRRCADSLLSQSFRDFELLLVDDGSTDRSGLMADQLAMEDSRVSVRHKPNGGLADARNYGIEISQGDYIAFIDSDDELASGTFAALMDVLERHPEYDMLEFPVLVNPERKGSYVFHPCDGDSEEYPDSLDWLAARGLSHCWVCNKIYRRRLFADTRFPVGNIYEDVYIMAAIVRQKPFIATVNCGLYIYHWNAESITANEEKKGMAALLDAQLFLVRELGIDTHERQWHRLYIDMLAIQTISYRHTEELLLWSQRVAFGFYGRWSNMLRVLLLNVFGIGTCCKLFKLLPHR